MDRNKTCSRKLGFSDCDCFRKKKRYNNENVVLLNSLLLVGDTIITISTPFRMKLVISETFLKQNLIP